MPSKIPSTSRSVTECKKPKKIKVYLNGEVHCYNFTINPREFKGWTAVLDYMTKMIEPRFGHIAKLQELSTKKQVQCFDDLVPSNAYIAMGVHSKFKQALGSYEAGSFQDILKRKPKLRKFYDGKPDPSLLPLLENTKKRDLRVAYFLVNGKTTQCAQKVILDKCDLKRSNLTHNFLAKILDVPDGVQNVATIFGDVLNDLREIQHGYPYVVIPHNKQFVKLDYLKFFSEESGCKPTLKFNIRPFGTKEPVKAILCDPRCRFK